VNFYPVRIIDVINETSHARSFKLRPGDEHQHLFDYKPGQFLTFRIPWHGVHHERCYSLSSSPSCDTELKVTVKRVKDGKVSNWFNDIPKPGDTIDVAPPSGRFVLRDNNQPLNLFSGGSGITPVISLIKQVLHETELSPRLLYANSASDQIIFKRELDDLNAQFPRRLYCHHHLDEVNGLISTDVIESFIADYLDRDYFVCGPGAFMELTEDVLIKTGVSHKNILIERFTSPDDSVANREAIVPVAAANDVAEFRATLDGKEHKVPYRQGETLLECMLANGLDPVHSCKDAHCGSCMVIRKTGKNTLRKSTVLSKRDKEKGYILLCQAIPQSDDVWVDCDA